jgi:hypothetical protein
MGLGGLEGALLGWIILSTEKKENAQVFEAYLLLPLLAIIVGPGLGFLAALPGIMFGSAGGIASIAVVGFVLGALMGIKGSLK